MISAYASGRHTNTQKDRVSFSLFVKNETIMESGSGEIYRKKTPETEQLVENHRSIATAFFSLAEPPTLL